jgi:hypothetical protein
VGVDCASAAAGCALAVAMAGGSEYQDVMSRVSWAPRSKSLPIGKILIPSYL